MDKDAKRDEKRSVKENTGWALSVTAALTKPASVLSEVGEDDMNKAAS